MYKGKRISKNKSKRQFRRGAVNVHGMNMKANPQRGGIRL